jgi:hypothetical protein
MNLPTLVHTYFTFAKFFFGPNTTIGLVHDFFFKSLILRLGGYEIYIFFTNTKISLACSNVNTKEYKMKRRLNIFKQNFGGLCIDL